MCDGERDYWNGIFERQRIPAPAQSSGAVSQRTVGVTQTPSSPGPAARRSRCVRASPIAVSLYHTSISVCQRAFCEGVRRGHLQTDLSHYSDVALRSLRIKGLCLDTTCASRPHVHAAYFYPFTSIWASYATKLLSKQCSALAPATKHVRYFPKIVSKKRTNNSV